MRGGAVFLTLRDRSQPVRAGHLLGGVRRGRAARRRGRVVIFARPDFNANRGSFALTALEIRAVGVGELLARLERLRRQLAAEGLFSPERKRPIPFLPGVIGLICGRDSAAQRDVQQNASRRWPAVRFRVEQTAVQGPYAVEEITDALRRLDADPEVDVICGARRRLIEDLLRSRTGAGPGGDGVPDAGGERDRARAGRAARLLWPTCARHADGRGQADRARRRRADRAHHPAARQAAGASPAGWTARRRGWRRSSPGLALADPVREIERQAERVDAPLQRPGCR